MSENKAKMHFIIKPDDDSFKILMETTQYQNIWKQHGRKIRKSFREVTGLDFQQRVITARVCGADKIEQSLAGSPYYPMKLRADFRSEPLKLLTIVHELSHRLMGGNALGVVNLGISKPDDINSDKSNEIDHRNIYLFEYDVIKDALGPDWARLCREYEEAGEIDDYHTKAWKWAINLSYSQRQEKLKKLTKRAVIREDWDKHSW